MYLKSWSQNKVFKNDVTDTSSFKSTYFTVQTERNVEAGRKVKLIEIRFGQMGFLRVLVIYITISTFMSVFPSVRDHVSFSRSIFMCPQTSSNCTEKEYHIIQTSTRSKNFVQVRRVNAKGTQCAFKVRVEIG